MTLESENTSGPDLIQKYTVFFTLRLLNMRIVFPGVDDLSRSPKEAPTVFDNCINCIDTQLLFLCSWMLNAKSAMTYQIQTLNEMPDWYSSHKYFLCAC